MSIVVIGATGKLGMATIDALIERGVDPSSILAAGRNVERLEQIAKRGIPTIPCDLADPECVTDVLTGARRVLLVSVPGNPNRLEQHEAAIRAAGAAGVELFVYTSFLHADRNPDHLDHLRTERLLLTSGLQYTIMRNGRYFSSVTRMMPEWLKRGEIEGAAGQGRISAATHGDLAVANATVLTTNGHSGSTYELGIDDAFTMGELAAELSRQAGTDIAYTDLPADQLRVRLIEAGNTEALADRLVISEVAAADGFFCTDSGDLARLVGRPLVGLSKAISSTLSQMSLDG
jgi:NAD(P)H dehydrogenase (quinone)